jgi:hypothetical protein
MGTHGTCGRMEAHPWSAPCFRALLVRTPLFRALHWSAPRAARPTCRAAPVRWTRLDKENRPANGLHVPASPEQDARDVRPSASIGQICLAAG